MRATFVVTLLLLVAQPGVGQDTERASEIEANLRAEVRLRASLRERRSEQERARERAGRYAPQREGVDGDRVHGDRVHGDRVDGDRVDAYEVDAEQRLRSYDILAEQQRVREQKRSTQRIESEIDGAQPDVDRERLRGQLRATNRHSDFEARLDRLDRTLRRANAAPDAGRPARRSGAPTIAPKSGRLPAH